MTAKTILITGCSSGIGHDAAHGLKRRGWRVLATCRKPEDCARLEAEGLESFPLDAGSEESVAAGATEALERTDGRLDALFNNAAHALPGLCADLPRQGLREIYETNLFGAVDLTNRILPAMKARGSGRIVMNSSILGFIALRARGAYVSTKFAMEGITDTYRLENTHPGIHFILIEPGPITSMIRQNSRAHFERWIDWQGSAERPFYERELLKRLYRDAGKPDRFELPAEAVTHQLIRALEAPRPKARYHVTTPTRIMAVARRLLPTRILDEILRRN
ncbi:SDR family NAD(P)-dependent oxidoreductase [Halovulum dunhuangense]|uniref:SDR family NAD(P)-dependent oxidoreductase n=1 Tax=Halovulum dunhuangense TaxID=1505036 RepID=A0A849L5Y5_9RHOB|nr:SDR family NAD(P)-dependent oxidoreductase [Halovulum dunhuangense]NNU81531.1 SDR family NAD(P)-dependent oxidoreductase [Halovulum dunhuangense]